MKHGIFFQIKDNLIAQGVCKSAEEFTPEWAQLINLVITQANDENPFSDKTSSRFRHLAEVSEAKIEGVKYQRIKPHKSLYHYIWNTHFNRVSA